MLRESLLWAEVEEGGDDHLLTYWLNYSIKANYLCSLLISAVCLCLQVEEEATDKDNKNCSKDGMCGKVRLCLPLSSLWSSNSLSEFLCFCVFDSICVCYEFSCLCPNCIFCCRIFSSCWGTEGMAAPRKGDCYLLTTHRRHQLSSVFVLIQTHTQQQSAISGHQLHSIYCGLRSHRQYMQTNKHLQINKSNKQKHKKLQTHEQELLNSAHHNHALSRALSINLKSWNHASLFLIGRSLKWNVTCKWEGFEPSLKAFSSTWEKKGEANEEFMVD